MPMTAAERQQRYKLRLKAQDEEAAKEKERSRWHQRKPAGKIKLINDLTPRAQGSKRKYWKNDNRKRARKRKIEEESEQHDKNEDLDKSETNENETSENLNISVTSQVSQQANRGRKKIRKDRAVCYRRIK